MSIGLRPWLLALCACACLHAQSYLSSFTNPTFDLARPIPTKAEGVMGRDGRIRIHQ